MKAFPSNGFYERTSGGEQPKKLDPVMGMDLRDYFAAKAMQGMMFDPDHQIGAWDNYQDWHKHLTTQAYEIADAMMEARKK